MVWEELVRKTFSLGASAQEIRILLDFAATIGEYQVIFTSQRLEKVVGNLIGVTALSG